MSDFSTEVFGIEVSVEKEGSKWLVHVPWGCEKFTNTHDVQRFLEESVIERTTGDLHHLKALLDELVDDESEEE